MYDRSGKIIRKVTDIKQENKLMAPEVQGIYIIRLVLTNGKQATVNLLVK